jgi:hypothetical protein
MTEQQPIILTVERTRELLAQAIADRGEGFVYREPLTDVGCLYWHDPRDPGHSTPYNGIDPYDGRGEQGQPGCLVGYVFHAAGVAATELACRERRDATTLATDLRNAGWLDSIDEDSVTLLSVAQGRQDDGEPWGLAVEYAEANFAARKQWAESVS